jgi:hypothetical protein
VDICEILYLSNRAKTVERPGILRLIVTENVNVAVIRKDAKITCAGRIPASVEFVDFKRAAKEDETERALVSAVPRMTFDANFVHRASTGWKGVRRKQVPSDNGKFSSSDSEGIRDRRNAIPYRAAGALAEDSRASAL